MMRPTRLNFQKYTDDSYNSTTTKIQTIPMKNGQKLQRDIFSKRRHTDGQQAHKKTLNITDYYINAKQNYSEVPSNTSQNGHH